MRWQLRTIWFTGMMDTWRYRFRKERIIWYIPREGTYDCSGVYHSTYARGVSKRPYSGGSLNITRTWATERSLLKCNDQLNYGIIQETINAHLWEGLKDLRRLSSQPFWMPELCQIEPVQPCFDFVEVPGKLSWSCLWGPSYPSPVEFEAM